MYLGKESQADDCWEIERDFETLVRASNRMHCNCMELASPALLDHMTDYLNSLLTAVN